VPENFVGKSCTKTFSGIFGKIPEKILRPPKFACCYINDEKAPTILLPHFLKDSGRNTPAMPPLPGVPVHIILHALSLLVVVGYNVSL